MSRGNRGDAIGRALEAEYTKAIGKESGGLELMWVVKNPLVWRGHESSARWVGPGEEWSLEGYVLPDGMIYVQDSDERGDAVFVWESFIMADKPVERGIDFEANGWEPYEHWRRYCDLSPRQRGCYLFWNSTGRKEPSVSILYVFIFFFGLERWLLNYMLMETAERDEARGEETRRRLIEEIRRLLGVYGSHESFHRYALNVLELDWAIFSEDLALPSYLSLDRKGDSALALRIVLSRYCERGIPLPSEIAYRWVLVTRELASLTVLKRCSREVEALFSVRYREKYGDGMRLERVSEKHEVRYKGGSRSLRSLPIPIKTIVNVYDTDRFLEELVDVYQSCLTDLDSYSRYLGRKGNDASDLGAYALLPYPLLLHEPGCAKGAEELRELCQGEPRLIAFRELVGLFPCTQRKPFGKKEVIQWTDLIEGFGVGIAPNLDVHGVRFDANALIVVFEGGHGPTFKVSEVFSYMRFTIRLFAVVSQKDDEWLGIGQEVLRDVISEEEGLSDLERRSLLAFLLWSMHTPQQATGLKVAFADLTHEGRKNVMRVMIGLALAGDMLEVPLIFQLEKLDRMLDISKGSFGKAFSEWRRGKSFRTGREKVDLEPAVSGFSQSELGLDRELIRLRRSETDHVRSLLVGLFDEGSGERGGEKPAVGVQASVEGEYLGAGEVGTGAVEGDLIRLLSKEERQLLRILLTQEEWDLKEVEDLCTGYNLTIDGVLEELNSWSIEVGNAPLIEYGDVLYVEVGLGRMLLGEKVEADLG